MLLALPLGCGDAARIPNAAATAVCLPGTAAAVAAGGGQGL